MGRGTIGKFNEETCEIIYQLKREGYKNVDICNVVGITPATLYNWIKRGKKAKSGKYKEFYKEIEKAKTERKYDLLAELKQLGHERNDWKAVAWILERSYGDEFARPEVKIKQELNGKIDTEMKVDLTRFERKLKKLE